VSELSALGYALLAGPVIFLVLIAFVAVILAGARAGLALVTGEASQGGVFGRGVAAALVILALMTLGVVLVAIGELT
jgi:hypothetical protein